MEEINNKSKSFAEQMMEMQTNFQQQMLKYASSTEMQKQAQQSSSRANSAKFERRIMTETEIQKSNTKSNLQIGVDEGATSDSGNNNSSRNLNCNPKLEFPKFDGRNPRIWINKCSTYFELCEISKYQQVKLASLYMIDKAESWMDSYMSWLFSDKDREYVDWIDFIMALNDEFRVEVASSFWDQFEKLQQHDTLETYIDDFENLRSIMIHSNRMFPPDDYLIDSFIDGLKPAIKGFVRSSKPVTITSAMEIARQHDSLYKTMGDNSQKQLKPQDTSINRAWNEFPKFDGSNTRMWINECEKFFAVFSIPYYQRGKMASLHMFGRAETWFELYQFNRRYVIWEEMIVDLLVRFKDDFQVSSSTHMFQVCENGVEGVVEEQGNVVEDVVVQPYVGNVVEGVSCWMESAKTIEIEVGSPLKSFPKPPLLCYDKNSCRSLASQDEAMSQMDNLQAGYNAVRDEAVLVAEKTIRMKRRESEKPSAPFLSLPQKEESAKIIVSRDEHDRRVVKSAESINIAVPYGVILQSAGIDNGSQLCQTYQVVIAMDGQVKPLPWRDKNDRCDKFDRDLISEVVPSEDFIRLTNIEKIWSALSNGGIKCHDVVDYGALLDYGASAVIDNEGQLGELDASGNGTRNRDVGWKIKPIPERDKNEIVVVTNAGSNVQETHGGYSDLMDYHYVFCFLDNLPPDSIAPLLCAGTYMCSSMKYYGLMCRSIKYYGMTEPRKHVGMAELGELGHVDVKLGKALGLKVNSSPKNESEDISKHGDDAYFVSSDPGKVEAALGIMDFTINIIDFPAHWRIGREGLAEIVGVYEIRRNIRPLPWRDKFSVELVQVSVQFLSNGKSYLTISLFG